MLKTVRVAIGCTLLLLATAVNCSAAIVYYSDRSVFTTANPGLSVEDFQDVNNSFVVVSGPQDRFSSNIAFSPGDIIPNLRITAVGSSADEFYVNTGSYGPTTVLTTNYASNFARLDFFEGGTTAFGVDLSSTSAGSPYQVRIFDAGGLVDTFVVPAFSGVAFFGFTSTSNVLRVEIQSPVFETFDNITIGAAAPVPEPASMLAWGLIAGVGAVGYRLRNRKKVVA